MLDAEHELQGVAEQAVPGWDNEQASEIFEQMYTENEGKIDGVLAANDGLGGSAISILQKNGVAGKVPVTGQDATVQGLQDILAGNQCMTVYKSAKQEAGALADAGHRPGQGRGARRHRQVKDTEGGRDVPAVLLDPRRSPRRTSRRSSTTVAPRPPTSARASRSSARRPGSPDPDRRTRARPPPGAGPVPCRSHRATAPSRAPPRPTPADSAGDDR